MQEQLVDVANATGIEPHRLEKLEAGHEKPTGDEILILADHFRCDFNFFISNEALAPYQQTETLYRAHGNEFTKQDRRAIQDFLYLCETEEFLLNELGIERRRFDYMPQGNFYKSHGEQAAIALRKHLGYDDRVVPRDVYADFRSAGVHVFRRRLENSSISGLFVMHPTAGKCALINYDEDIYRQRFSAAHEMAHAIFDWKADPRVSFDRSARGDMLEIRANRFASCFLLPAPVLAVLSSQEWSHSNAVRWANELRVSCNALAVALKAYGAIDADTSNRISKLRIPKDDKVDPELPNDLTSAQRARKSKLLELGLSDSYVKLCFEAFSQGIISLGRLDEALLCGRSELANIASLYGQALHVH